MPKEYIHSVNDTRTSSEQGWPFSVRIGWSREAEYVQIATVNPEGETRSTESSDPSVPTEEVKVEGGWFVDLDRHGINDLIRILRRARDQAFGRDE